MMILKINPDEIVISPEEFYDENRKSNSMQKMKSTNNSTKKCSPISGNRRYTTVSICGFPVLICGNNN